MPPDEAADVLGDIEEGRVERILCMMEPEEADDVRELLRYEDDTAGGRMTTEYIALPETMNAAQAIAALREQAPDAETVYYVYVTDPAGRLQGVLSLRDLITAEDTTLISELVQRDVVRVSVEDDQETAARQLNHYHLLAIPVVDAAGVLRGIVTVDDVLDVLHEEAREDLSRVAGAVEESAMLDNPWDRMLLRLPWLLGAAAACLLVAAYLATSNQLLRPLLALLPLILLIGTQIGGQGAATVQVAIGDDESFRDILPALLRRQWPIGAAVSLLAALAAALFIAATDSHGKPLTVSLIVWLILLLEMVVGSLLPLVLRRLHWDPVLVNRPALAILALALGVPLLAQAL